MFTALASLFSDGSVRKDVAMTGEVTLRGLVLPIGGLKEKTLAALNARIRTVLIPKSNEKDIPDLPEEVRERLEIMPVKTADEVLKLAIERLATSSFRREDVDREIFEPATDAYPGARVYFISAIRAVEQWRFEAVVEAAVSQVDLCDLRDDVLLV